MGSLCIAILASWGRAQDTEAEPPLLSYRPIADVVGILGCHSSAGMAELMTIWRAEFERIYPAARVVLDDDSFDDVGRGAATFGPRLGVHGESAVGRFKSRFGYSPMEVPVGYYVLAVLVRRDNPCREGLHLEEVETIFSALSWDVTWGDLGCDGDRSKRAIRLHVPDWRAPVFLLRQFDRFLMKDSVAQHKGDADAVAGVEGDALGLGLAEVGNLTDKVRALAIADVGGAKFVAATAENARNGSYPLTGKFYLTLNHRPEAGFPLDPLRREFLRYILSREGQQAVVKAGHVALSAEQAERALAKLGLTPTGNGIWDPMISNLRERELPLAQRMRIEQQAAGIGDQPTNEQLVDLANVLARTKLKSLVSFATEEEGATIRFRFLGQRMAVPVSDWSNRVEATIPIGLYCVWTEREGKATSPMDAWFAITRERERIKIWECPEARRG